MMVETRQKLESEKTRVYTQKPRLKMLFENSFAEFWRRVKACALENMRYKYTEVYITQGLKADAL